jgi:hypothetical protein
MADDEFDLDVRIGTAVERPFPTAYYTDVFACGNTEYTYCGYTCSYTCAQTCGNSCQCGPTDSCLQGNTCADSCGGTCFC